MLSIKMFHEDFDQMNLAWFRLRKWGSLSLLVSLVEIFVIWGGSAVVAPLMPQLDWKEFQSLTIYVYGGSFMGSLVLSIVGLATDTRRIAAALALALTFVNLGICSVPIAY